MITAITTLIWVVTCMLAGFALMTGASYLREFMYKVLVNRDKRLATQKGEWWRTNRCSVGKVLANCTISNWQDLKPGERLMIQELIKEGNIEANSSG